MPRISALEFERLPLRVHAFLAGVPLHDVWAVDLPRIRPGITLDEFLRTGGTRSYRLSLVVRALLSIRLCIGWLLCWDREPTPTAWKTFATRLTTADRSKSLAAVGTRDGLCRVVYRFENDQLAKRVNQGHVDRRKVADIAHIDTEIESVRISRFDQSTQCRSMRGAVDYL